MNNKISTLVILLVVIVATSLVLGFVRPADEILQGGSVIQVNSYIDNNSKFKINLPIGWTVQDVASSTSSSNTWFHDVSKEETRGAMTLVIGRFERTSSMDKSIKEFGEAGFVEEMSKQVRSGINQYSVISTSTIMINEVPYYLTVGSYVGGKTNKKVIQYTYLTLTDSAYYLIGIDTYEEIWEKNKEIIFESVSTLKLL